MRVPARHGALTQPHIAVAGAGIGGLAAASALAQAGCRVTLLERAPELAEVGAGVQLSPNATRVLRRLGVLDRVEASAVRLDALAIGRGRDGAALARMPLGDAAEGRFGGPFLVLLRADLQRTLLDAVRVVPGVVLRTGAALAAWRETPGGLAVEPEGSPAFEADGLVGADGIRSVAARGIVGAAPRERVRRSAWRSLVDTARLPALFAEPVSRLWLGGGAHVVHYPVRGARLVNVVAVLDEPMSAGTAALSWSGPGNADDLLRRLGGWRGPVRTLLDAATSWNRWPLIERPALPTWSRGAVTLLGDAAHPMLPFLAQGAAQALEDAAALGAAVSARPHDPAAAFARYEAVRKPRADRVQAESRRQATVYHLPAPVSATRDLILRLTPPDRLLSRYDWLYGRRSDEP